MDEWIAQMAESAEWMVVRSAWLKLRVKTEVFGLWDFPTFSILQRLRDFISHCI